MRINYLGVVIFCHFHTFNISRFDVYQTGIIQLNITTGAVRLFFFLVENCFSVNDCKERAKG